jgi:ABC-type sugar transport system ATPase subunit
VTLLELDHVSKAYRGRARKHVGLRNVSLRIYAGERVAVYGERRSGRSALLRVAAGIDPPDAGVVRFEGRDLRDCRRSNALATPGIGFCTTTFRVNQGRLVLDQLIVGLLAGGVSRMVAQSQACAALERVGAEHCAMLAPAELDGLETTLVAIARTLAQEPKLLVIDEPTIGVDLLARDQVLLLLRSLSDDGIAVLSSTGEVTGLSGVDRALFVDDGQLRGRPDDGQLRGRPEPESATVIPLHTGDRQSASA